MNILVICQYYYPEPFRITDICEEWVKRGHDVTVVTGLPNYPAGEIYEGYRAKDKRDEVIGGVKVHRCYEIPRKKGLLFRFLNYYSFAWSATRYVKTMKKRFDVVFANQLSPVMMVAPAVVYKKKYGTRVVLYCLDLWPESLIVGGVKRGSLLYRHYHKVSAHLYHAVDEIAITSKQFERYFAEHFGIEGDRICYLPQYAESVFDAEQCQKQESEQIDLVFAGNVGVAPNVETIIRAAAKTQDISELRWHIVGDGSSLEHCKELAEKLGVQTVTFHGRKSLEDMPQYYKRADAMLVTLIDDDELSLTLPGKVQSYMAAGKPILAAANGEIPTVIREADCGICVGAEDCDQLAQAVREFCALPKEKRTALGQNAAHFYKQHFSKTVFFEKVDELLNEGFNHQ